MTAKELLSEALKPSTLLFAIGHGLLFYLLFTTKGNETAVYNSSKPKVIEKRIEIDKSNIELYRKQIRQDSLFKGLLNQRLKTLQTSLLQAKSVKDTVLIIGKQDTIIKVQEHIIYTLENTSEMKDSIIGSLYSTVQNKDTLITIYKQESKRIKKQRNWLIALNILLATVIVLK